MVYDMRLHRTTLPGTELEGYLLAIFLHDLPSPTVAQAGLQLLAVMLQVSPGLFLPLIPTTYPVFYTVQTWPREVKGQYSQTSLSSLEKMKLTGEWSSSIGFK